MQLSVAAPYLWPQTDTWLGQDGNWSTLELSVGSPPQVFHILPSTSSSQIWLPVPEGCSWPGASTFDCATSRGVAGHGKDASGFEVNSSASWRQTGLYELDAERELYGSDENGLFGIDNVVLGTDNSSLAVDNQSIAGIGTQDFWLGSVGLGDDTTTFSLLNGSAPSLLSTIAANNFTSSVAFGFFAGASYKSLPASLVLGGYDSAMLPKLFTSFSIPPSSALIVNLASIVTTNSLLGTASLLVSSTGLTMMIDSTVSHLWLPIGVCDMMTKAFGLLYDNSTGLYLVNGTTHARLQELNPQLTFTLATGPGSSSTINIVLPYAAFDMTVGLPIYNATYRYFPIRRAANETQYVLGRAFLQEAYLVVDWERGNFSIGQVVHETGQTKSVVAILSPNLSSARSVTTFQMPAGAIAGAILGGVALLALSFWWTHRTFLARRTVEGDPEAVDKETLNDAEPSTIWQDEKATIELMSSTVHELNAGVKTAQIMSAEVFELDAASPSQELEVSTPATLPLYEKDG